MRYNFYAARSSNGAVTVNPATNFVAISTSTAGTTANLHLGLDRPSGLFGVYLAIASLQVCYATQGGGRITATDLLVGERNDGTVVNEDTTVRPATATATADTCYTATLPLNTDRVYLDSAKLVLTPTAAGAAEAPLPPGPPDR